ncbi:MAG: enoyl-CoA hydratase/isomerase family protein [Longimicrobiales bacterium]|nr:enoyl-CoA hydratase/isomerase family protein [Longimicrobiales bacterium]
MATHVLYEVRGGLARVTLNHPERRNALSLDMLESMDDALAKAAAAPEVKAVWLGAKGAAFCAGMDLKAADLSDPAEADRYARAFSSVYRSLLTLPVPLLCAVDGPATGGGVGLPAAADLVWARPGVRFALPETRVGIAPALVSVVLARRLTPKKLMALAVGGIELDGEGAREVGLVDFVADDAGEASLAFARNLLRNHSPEATRRTKEFLLGRLPPDLDEQLEAAEDEFRAAVGTDAARRGLAAFREKRSIVWGGDI